MRDLLRITVEHQCWPRGLTEKWIAGFTDTLFPRLAPSRMIYRWIDIRIKTIRLGPRLHPRTNRLVFNEANRDDGFDALEAVLPRSDEAERCSILIGQRLSIHADSD